jgi:hypothetical protein
MFEILEGSAGSVVGIRVFGEVTDEDYDRLLPELKRVIDEHGELNFLCRFDGASGLEKEAVWRDLKFTARHLSDLSRCAVVKDQDWQDMLGRLGSVFPVEVRVYRRDDEEAAWTWLLEAAGQTEGGGPARVRRRARAAGRRLEELAGDLRADGEELGDPRAQALFETAAEALDGLRTAFRHFEERSEPAWRDEAA